MWPFQNSVRIVGWIERVHSSSQDREFSFRILQPGYHEHFSSATSDRENLLNVEVWTYGSKLAELCRQYLKRGDRIQVCGRLVPVKSEIDAPVIGIEAWSVERAEALEAFRFINHVWNHELRSMSSERSIEPLRSSDVEGASP